MSIILPVDLAVITDDFVDFLGQEVSHGSLYQIRLLKQAGAGFFRIGSSTCPLLDEVT